MSDVDYCKELNRIASNYDYCDAKLLGAFCHAFLGRLILFHEFDEKRVVKYIFDECYKVSFFHADEQIQDLSKRRWSPNDYTFAQIDYFIQDVSFSLKSENDKMLFESNIDVSIAKLYVLSGKVEIQLLNIDELSSGERANIVLKGDKGLRQRGGFFL